MNTKLVMLMATLFVVKVIVAQSDMVNEGSGSFKVDGGNNHHGDSITIFYHRPVNFTQNSKILMVIPGAGRNGDDYRDSWIETSEKHSVLIISPSYPEKEYNYGDYHLGGVVKDLNLSKGISFKKGTNQVLVDENIVLFNINNKKEDWIYDDFDRIFEMVKRATKSRQKKYDLFGHSAGGQILHRFVLFSPNSKANKILASNAGTYTLPDYKENYPFGMKNVDARKLRASFKKELVLFLGELDNESETRGRMLRSKTADIQGTHRLARGKYFCSYSTEAAKNLGMKFNWKLEVIANVGHNQKKMAEFAANYLYE
ncbi:hypothetical protein DKG77_03440 [Flagellimonas aquimarina]|uniref:Alpha/beta hydrolase n=1 Tax=Flagellimonas aquimarina TaxID=2201895 RepID=A0A316L067_9FLAO|nr:hypothetical protein [Allomuricauda koreensis]PWL39897.1 hypothetical protein DKG77_03440 [Allomuricauda koreensis]